MGEADFALKVDGGNSEIAAFRANAARSLALQQIAESHQVATQGKFRDALKMIDGAKVLSSDPAVVQEAATARTALAAMADAEAERMRQSKAYPDAIEALSVAVSIDGSKRGKLDALQAEYESFRTAEYERLARDGDMALARSDWAAAESSYVAALKVKPGGRAEPLARYRRSGRRGFRARTPGLLQRGQCLPSGRPVRSGHERLRHRSARSRGGAALFRADSARCWHGPCVRTAGPGRAT